MEKRVLIAALLSFLVLLLWPRSSAVPERPQPVAGPASVERAVDVAEPEKEASAQLDLSAAVVAEPTAALAEERITITTSVFEVELTNRGGRALSWKLLDYKTTKGEPLQLLPQFEDRQRFLALEVADERMTETLNAAFHRMERERTSDPPGERVRFVWADGLGFEASKTLSFEDSSYVVGVDVEARDRGRDLAARVAVGPGFGAQETAGNYDYESVVWNESGTVTHHQRSAKHGFSPLAALPGRARWAGLEDQYFAALLVPAEGGGSVGFRREELTRPPIDGEKTAVPGEGVVSVSMPEEGNLLFVGPKDYRLLEQQGHGLEQVVWFFSNGFLNWISRQIYFGLVWIHGHTIANYGLAIILATFVLRVLLLPVNQYSMVSMKKTQIQMQRLQPKIKVLRNKYKKSKDSDSRAKMNQEMMELYRTEGVNPMGGLNGCLPMLAQFPILIGFYGMLTVAVELRGAPFVAWIHDLSRHDPAFVLPVLMGVTMFLQQRMAMTKITDPVQLQQQRIMMFMPIVFTGICLQLPSGLVLYWFVSNLLGMGQQWLVNRHTARFEQAGQRA